MSFLTVSSQTTLLDNAKFFVFALYDSSAPTVLLEKIAPAKPYGNPLQVTFTYNMVQGHIYRFRLWESVDDTATGVVRNSANVNGSTSSVAIREPIYAQVGVTPGWVDGTNTIVDATLVGWAYEVTRNPEYLVPDGAPDNTQNDLVFNTDGFTLSGGIKFNTNEQWKLSFLPQITVAPAGTPSSPITTGRIITVDTVLTNADKNQALIISAATNTIKITLPDSTTLADFTEWLYIYSQGGNQINVEIALLSGADNIVWMNQNMTKFYLGKSESLHVFCFNKNYYVHSDPQGMKLVGSLMYSDSLTVLNYLLCNGQLLSRTAYPMLFAYVAGLGTVIGDVTWNANTVIDGVTVYPNKGKFSLGDGSTTFRLPLLSDMQLKGTSGVAGAYESWQSVQHQHEQSISHLASPPFGAGITVRTQGAYNGTTSGLSDFTSIMENNGGNSLTAVGATVRGESRLKYCLIRVG